jgi:hypothetical protein
MISETEEAVTARLEVDDDDDDDYDDGDEKRKSKDVNRCP